MQGNYRIVGRFLRDTRGATAVEFALVAMIFIMLFLGIVEYGLFMMAKIDLESAVTAGSRIAAIQGGSQSAGSCNATANVEAAVKQKVGGLINSNAVVFTSNTVAGGGAATPDICLDNPNNPTPPTCKNYYDGNNNGKYDVSQGAGCTGGSGDIIQVRVTYPWHILTPFLVKFFNGVVNGSVVITTTTIVKNE
jgi:Flp pilus assembly protein TadG